MRCSIFPAENLQTLLSPRASPDADLDMVRLKQLLVKVTRNESNKQVEDVQVANKIDLDSPICTTPNDSTPQYKTVVGQYEPPTPLPISF
jgi:hypothetical protein